MEQEVGKVCGGEMTILKKLDDIQEEIVSTQRIGDVIMIFTKHSIYVSGKEKDVDEFTAKLKENE